MRWLAESWKLRQLRQEGTRIRHDFCNSPKDTNIEEISIRNVKNRFAIDAIKTERLLRLADKYDVPVPSILLIGDRNEFWEQSPFDRNVKVLNERARSNFRAEIWAVQRAVWERWTRWIPFLSALTGLVGAAFGLIVAIQKWL